MTNLLKTYFQISKENVVDSKKQIYKLSLADQPISTLAVPLEEVDSFEKQHKAMNKADEKAYYDYNNHRAKYTALRIFRSMCCLGGAFVGGYLPIKYMKKAPILPKLLVTIPSAVAGAVTIGPFCSALVPDPKAKRNAMAQAKHFSKICDKYEI